MVATSNRKSFVYGRCTCKVHCVCSSPSGLQVEPGTSHCSTVFLQNIVRGGGAWVECSMLAASTCQASLRTSQQKLTSSYSRHFKSLRYKCWAHGVVPWDPAPVSTVRAACSTLLKSTATWRCQKLHFAHVLAGYAGLLRPCIILATALGPISGPCARK